MTYRRGYNWELVHYIEAPVGGWNPDAMPWELSVGQASRLDNFLVRPAAIEMRGGFQQCVDFTSLPAGGLFPTGAVCLDNVFVGQHPAGSPGGIDPWNAPLCAKLAGTLGVGDTSAFWASALLNTVTTVTVTKDKVPGPRWINFDGLLYGLSYDSTASAVQDSQGTYFMTQTRLLTLSKVSAAIRGRSTTWPTMSTSGGGLAWALTGTMNAGGNETATNSTPASTLTTNVLQAEGYGFQVPTGATIKGVGVTVYRQSFDGNPFSTDIDATVKLIKAGAVVGSNRADLVTHWPQNYGPANYGGPTDLWGIALTPADVNAANFGVSISANITNTSLVSAPFSAFASINTIIISVYYTASAATPTPTVLTNAPTGAFDLKGHLSRIWLLGGVDVPAAGSTHNCNALFYTNPISAGGGTASADWKDPVSGLTNQIIIDRDTSNYSVALATVRGGLLILRRNSIHILRGTTTANFTVQMVSPEIGCVDARSVIETEEGVYFMSTQGLMMSDGIRVVNVSGSVTDTLRQAVAVEQNSRAEIGQGYVTCALTSRGQIIISMGTQSPDGYHPICCMMYDRDTKTWSRITSTLWFFDAIQNNTSGNWYPGPLVWSLTPNQVFTLGNGYLTALENRLAQLSFNDVSQPLYDRWVAPTNYPGASLFNPVLYTPIPAKWKTRYAPVIGTSARKTAQAKRFFLDYIFSATSLTTTSGWQCVPVDSTDNQLAGGSVLTASAVQFSPTARVGGVFHDGLGHDPATNAEPPVSSQLTRRGQDFVNEISDVGFDIGWLDTTPLGTQPAPASQAACKLYGVGIEYQPGRDLR